MGPDRHYSSIRGRGGPPTVSDSSPGSGGAESPIPLRGQRDERTTPDDLFYLFQVSEQSITEFTGPRLAVTNGPFRVESL